MHEVGNHPVKNATNPSVKENHDSWSIKNVIRTERPSIAKSVEPYLSKNVSNILP